MVRGANAPVNRNSWLWSGTTTAGPMARYSIVADPDSVRVLPVLVQTMPTPTPPSDPFNPLIQELRERFESRYFPDEGLDATDSDVLRCYNRAFKLPFVRLLIRDVMSGRWDLGSTQQQVSERLGIERTRLSDALRHGELSLDVFMRLRTCPSKPADWEPDLQSLLPEMDRSGFIGVARLYASAVTDRPELLAESMTELNYELMCEMLRRFASWTVGRLSNDQTLALDIVSTVVNDSSRNITPSWYTPTELKKAQSQISRLSNAEAAFSHLSSLQGRWLDVFVVTSSQLEIVRWGEQ